MIGERRGAISIAPMITAAESVMSPNVAMELDRAVSSRNPAVNREERRRSPIERRRHHGTGCRDAFLGTRITGDFVAFRARPRDAILKSPSAAS